MNRDTTSRLAELRELVLQAVEPGISTAERAVKTRLVAESQVDQRDLLQVAATVLTGHVIDSVRASRGDSDAQERAAAWQALAEARWVVGGGGTAPMAGGGVGGPRPVGSMPAALPGIGDGLPLIRTLADRWTDPGDPLIPAAPSGTGLTGTVIDLAGTATADDTLTVGALSPAPTWTVAALIAQISRQFLDFAGDDAARYLDQLFYDATDRAAEADIATRLVAAGTSAAMGADLVAALDAAEKASAAALLAPASIVLANPADVPKVRRSVASSWLIDPHPTLYATNGLTAGNVIVTGPQAFVLAARPINVTGDADALPEALWPGQVKPSKFAYVSATQRHYTLAIRRPTAIRVITGVS